MPTQKADASNDATLNLVGTQLYRPGYVFVGWSGTPDGDVLYEDGGTVPHLSWRQLRTACTICTRSGKA